MALLVCFTGNILATHPILRERRKTSIWQEPNTPCYFFSCFLVNCPTPSRKLPWLSPSFSSLCRLSWETWRTACRMAFCTICLLAFCSLTSSGSFPGFSPRQKYGREVKQQNQFQQLSQEWAGGKGEKEGETIRPYEVAPLTVRSSL